MNLQKINWKFFIENPAPDLAQQCFRVFNTWIPESSEIFIDVADYSHVPAGPLTLLCGFQADVVLDAAGGKLGLLYNRKRPLGGDAAGNLRETFGSAVRAAQRLQDDASIPGGVKFSGGKILFFINDRALAPNTDATFQQVSPLLRQVLVPILGEIEFKHFNNPRERFAVEITPRKSGSISTWANR